MDELLLVLLQDIISAEYAQWMRYVYLSSLGYGPNTDPLVEQFYEHSNDELDHARRVTRWLVDLGGMPTTDMDPVEQFRGSMEEAINWLIEAEVSGIDKYNHAIELADCLGMHGLTSELGSILETEHEHMSELMNFIAPHMSSGDDTTMIIVANSFRRFACKSPELFKKLVINRFQNLNKKTADIFEETQGAWDIKRYMSGILDDAMQAVTSSISDTETLLQSLPEESRKWISQDIENQVTELWSSRDSEGSRSAILFYKNIYEWVNSSDTVSNWNSIYESYMPGWQGMFTEDWEQELEVGEEYKPTTEDMFQTIQETSKETSKEEMQQPQESVVSDEEVGQWVEESKNRKDQWDKKQKDSDELQDQKERELNILEMDPDVQEGKTRRPIETELEKTITVLDASSREMGSKNRTTKEVGVGDAIINLTQSRLLKREQGMYPQHANAQSTGFITSINEDDTIDVEIGSGDKKQTVTWNSLTDVIEDSRPKGQRTAEGQRLVN